MFNPELENFYIVYVSLSDKENYYWDMSDPFDDIMSKIYYKKFNIIATARENNIVWHKQYNAMIVIFDNDKENINKILVNKLFEHDPQTQILSYPSMRLIEWKDYQPQRRMK